MRQSALAFAPEHWLVDQLDEPFLYHDIQRPGFTALVMPGGAPRQIACRLRDLPAEIGRVRASMTDAYIAQNEFYRPNRRIVNCWRLTSCYVDLDTYKLDSLANLAPQDLTDMVLRSCDDQLIPRPSVVVYSGRGLQVKWLLAAPVPRGALPRWQLVQNELAARLSDLGADRRALDAARVLRLVGTVNRRSGDIVRVTYVNRCPTHGGTVGDHGAVTYEFDTICDSVLPLSRAELARLRSEREALANGETCDAPRPGTSSPSRGRSGAASAERLKSSRKALPRVPAQLAWDRLEDLRRLAAIRGWQEGAPSGRRNTFAFLGACFLATANVATSLGLEVRELAREFAPTWTEAEVHNCVSAVLKRAHAAAMGEHVEFGGRRQDPRYFFRNDTLIQLLEVTPGEMTQLRTIITKDEARRRGAERQSSRRRAMGCMTRAEYLRPSQDNAKRARELRAEGKSLAQIASILGVSRASASNYCRGL